MAWASINGTYPWDMYSKMQSELSSNHSLNFRKSRLRRITALAGLLACTAGSMAFSPEAHSKVFVTLNEALSQAFPASKKCIVKAETRYLTPEQMKQAQEIAGSPPSSALVVRHQATCEGKPGGYAYTDTHRVRTHPETLLVVVDALGKIGKVEVLSFDEPLEYIPRTEWYGTFPGATLGADLQLKRRIPFVTGASLTSQATTQATRRVLAIHQTLQVK